MSIIYRPAAARARGLENLNIYYEKTSFIINKIALRSLAKIVACSFLPLVLTLELIFKRLPKLLISCVLNNSEKTKKRFNKVQKFALAIISSPINLFSETLVSSFFLKNPHKKNTLAPFGVENIFVDLFAWQTSSFRTESRTRATY